MNVYCTNCGCETDVSKETEYRIERAKQFGFVSLEINCSICNRRNLIRLGKSKDLNLRCPIETCTGYISFVDNDIPPFWGCGECGNIWHKKIDLYGNILKIIEKFPFRKRVYLIEEGSIKPVPLQSEPPNYNEIVE